MYGLDTRNVMEARSESVALSVVSASKMFDLAGESSTTPPLPTQHFHNTVAGVFAECDMRLLEQLFVMDTS